MNTFSKNSRFPLREVWHFAVAVLIGAYLLFQVQLIIGKYILPWYGGSTAVWTTCMLVFQVLLLLGYVYAHLLAVRLSPSSQVKLHLSLMAVSVLVLAGGAMLWPTPITPGSSWKPEGSAQPILGILWLLTVAIGLPFFLLSTTSPLLQQWFARTRGLAPYRLFALSNFGSLLGLLTYPFLLEPNLTLKQQAWIWLGGYGAYLLFAAVCAVSTYYCPKVTQNLSGSHSLGSGSPEPYPGLGLHLLWLLLAACACIMFMATTNMLCQEIAVIPFLWVLPFSLYLVTFIACFESSRWYRRGLFHGLFIVGLVMIPLIQQSKVVSQIGSYSLALFAVGMICHGELTRLKPISRYLTHFYLMIALGGAFGGVFVALICPLVFPAFWEFQIALLGCGILLLTVLYRDKESWLHQSSKWFPLALLAGITLISVSAGLLAPAVFAYFSKRIYLVLIWACFILAACWIAVRPPAFINRYRWTQITALTIMTAAAAVLIMHMHSQIHGSLHRFRSFFGVFRVEQNEKTLALKHGQTTHGYQIRDGIADPTPTSYYATNTGIGKLLREHPRRKLTSSESGMRVGVVGLGTGTLAAYGAPWDYFCFYELDPAIARISYGEQAIFTFLKNSTADIDVVLGDGRLSLEQAALRGEFQRFDVLVLDAFSSDSIPVHLLTKEAMEIYLKHLRDRESVVAFHISNRILDLVPVLSGLSREFNLNLIIVETGSGPITSACTWGLLSPSPRAFDTPKLKPFTNPTDKEGNFAVLWTDDYSNIFRLISKKAWW